MFWQLFALVVFAVMRKRGLDPYSVCCVVQSPARALPAVCVTNHLVADVPAVLELCPNLGKNVELELSVGCGVGAVLVGGG